MAEEEATNDLVGAQGTDTISGQPPADPPPAEDTVDAGAGDTVQPAAGDDLLSDDEVSDDEGVPDQYTFEPQDGVAVDEVTLDAFKGVAKELGLTQKAFTKLVEFDIQRSQAVAESAVNGWNQRVNGWRDGARADTEIGGDKFDASIKTANRMVKQFGDDALRSLLRSPSQHNPEGLAIGNHPAVLRFLNRVAAVISDPDPIEGADRQPPRNTLGDKAQRMYPTMQKK